MALKFSVITPSYNQGPFIERTIQSVLLQTEADWEYMVCDGGSSDSTIEVLRRYQNCLRWVSESDRGQADAVNKGIQTTTGDIIAWINSDDIYYPEAFRKVKHVFETRPDVQVIYGNANHIDQNDQVIEPYPTEDWSYRRLKDTCFISQPAVFFRRQLVSRCGGLNANLNFCMDYELWLRYGQHTPFFYLPELLAGSRLYQDTKTLGQRVAVHYEIGDMLKEKFYFVPEKWVLAYASVVVDEKEKAEEIDNSTPRTRVERMNLFLSEAVSGYWRWRHFCMSPASMWMLFRWTAKAYYQFVYHQLSSTLKS